MTPSVLLVDDDSVFRSLATRILNEAGLGVIGTVGDAAGAVAAALSLKPDAALVDIGLQTGTASISGMNWLPCRGDRASCSPPRTVTPLARIDRNAADGGLSFIPKEDLPSAPLLRSRTRIARPVSP